MTAWDEANITTTTTNLGPYGSLRRYARIEWPVDDKGKNFNLMIDTMLLFSIFFYYYDDYYVYDCYFYY